MKTASKIQPKNPLETLDGGLWPICHSNVVRPSLGSLAPPSRRLAAFCIDLLIPILGFVIFTTLLMRSMDLNRYKASQGFSALQAVLVIVGSLLCIIYLANAIVLFTKGTTPGKCLLNMWVINEDGGHAGFITMILRECIGKLLSSSALMIGFLWILFDRENQGWHDKLASTHVVTNKERSNPYEACSRQGKKLSL